MASSSRAPTFHALKGQCKQDIDDGYEVYFKISDCMLLMQQKVLEQKKKLTEIKNSRTTITVSEEMHADYLASALPMMNDLISEFEKLLTLVNKKIDYATTWKLSAEDGFR